MELWQFKQMQSLPLEVKIEKTKQRIKEWYEHWDGQVYVSFSGGKDSTVLLNLVRELYPDVPAVFVDTGLEYPEIREFVKTIDNVVWIKPVMNFRQVIEKYGYPVLSKEKALFIRECQNKTEKNEITRRLRLQGIRSDGVKVQRGKIPEKWKYLVDAPFKISEQCCDVMKKKPFHIYEKQSQKKPFTGVLAQESQLRERQWLKEGCNAFENKRGAKSAPLSFWTDQDILQYIKKFNINYADVYGRIVDYSGQLKMLGVQRTGCMFCMFGCHLEKEPNRFQLMQKTHPKLHEYCMRDWEKGGLGLAKVLDYINVSYKYYVPQLKDYDQIKIV